MNEAPLGFWSVCKADPKRIVLIDHDETPITAGEMLANVNKITHALRARGLKAGSHVACVSGNRRETLELYFAAAQSGWFIVPINWHLTASEIAYILEDCGAEALLCIPEFAQKCTEALSGAASDVSLRLCAGEAEGFESLASVIQDQPADEPDDRTPGAAMHYTSGTSGRPKGVRRRPPESTPDENGARLGMFLWLFGLQPYDNNVHLTLAPLYHTAILNFTAASLHMGHKAVLLPSWDAEAVLQRIDRYKVTHTHMVPTHFIRLLDLPEPVRAKYDVHSMTHAIHGAAPCPKKVKRQMIEWWGPVIIEYYAATEGGGTIIDAATWLKKPGSVGQAWPGSFVEIRDENGEVLPAGEVGTVYMRMGEMTFEYHGDEKKTQEAWQRGFFTVGDAGYLDEEGYLFLVDRKSDMIISGGVNIYPAEIESEMIMHPKVRDIAVFGIPHAEWGEEVKAVVEPAEGVTPDEALATELLGWASEKLARYKCPRSIDFIQEMPRDPNGKLYKRKLRDPYWQGQERQI